MLSQELLQLNQNHISNDNFTRAANTAYGNLSEIFSGLLSTYGNKDLTDRHDSEKMNSFAFTGMI